MDLTVSQAWTILGNAFLLRPEAFAAAVRLPNAWLLAAAVVLTGGLSEAIGQSVVLFANRVQRGRFIFSLLVNATLFAFGYVFATVSTWLILRLAGAAHVPFRTLAIALAVSYVPLVFSFLVALPYLGYGIGWLLRTVHLLAMVVAVSAVADVDAFLAFAYVGIGWLVLSIAQQTIGRPIARLGERILNAVAGVEIVSKEQLLVKRLPLGQSPATVDGGAQSDGSTRAVTVDAPKRSNAWKGALGIGAMLALGYVLALTLAPVHTALFGWQEHLPRAAQLPLNLFWIAIVGLLVAGFMAPLETLGWWAGWYGDNVRDAPSGDASLHLDGERVARYVVYLDGISQSGEAYTPDIEAFLEALAPRLPTNYRLVRGVMAYSVLNRPLDQDPVLSWFWRLIEDRRSKNAQSLLGMFINIRNVLIVAVSADTRYGPIYNYGIGQLVYDSLIASGYPKASGTPVTFVGYSGGGQMSAASAAVVKRALGAPVDVISLGGVMSGNVDLLALEHLYHFAGDQDRVQALGPIMFPSRWKTAVLSNWNRATRLGRVSIFSLGPIGHQVPGGIMDPDLQLPSGETALDQTLERIDQVLGGRIERTRPATPVVESNYARYIASFWNTPQAYPLDARVDERYYAPAAQWIGRLVLPSLAERGDVRGVWFEVHAAPLAQRALVGCMVRLRWSDTEQVQAFVRAVTRDVHFSAQAQHSSEFKGLVTPVRLDHWQLVDPLESLAGAHPIDDVIVGLFGPIEFEAGEPATLRIRRHPVQITGRYRAVVRLTGKRDGDCFEAVHFDRMTRRFEGPAEMVRAPEPVLDSDGREPSNMGSIESSPLNEDGWHIYGSPDAKGVFVVQALLPRGAFLVPPRRTAQVDAAREYAGARIWKTIAERPGSALQIPLGESDWQIGDQALVLHAYGGIGGKRGERLARGPVYFGHFSCGFADVVADELTGDSRFDITYEQIYTHNVDGIIAGASHMSRYLGDRQFGWAGLRPTTNMILKLEPFTSPFALPGGRRVSPLDAVLMQLEAMTARYRIGDGTGATFVGPANNCAQDTGRAFFSAIANLDRLVAGDEFSAWQRENPQEARRFEELLALSNDLRGKLQSFGSPRRDWSDNEFNLGSTMTDDLLESIKISLGSWRMLLPRMANDTIAKAFLENGATGCVIATAQIGAQEGLTPVVPMTLPC